MFYETSPLLRASRVIVRRLEVFGFQPAIPRLDASLVPFTGKVADGTPQFFPYVGLAQSACQLGRLHALRVRVIGVTDQRFHVRRVAPLIGRCRVVAEAIPAHHCQEISVAELEGALCIEVGPYLSRGRDDLSPVRRIGWERIGSQIAPEAQQFIPAAGAACALVGGAQCVVAIFSGSTQFVFEASTGC
ncbi:hypothetical protein RT97_22550 [Variovorax paradoxus]|uniref:Uncharacterized protein n=1 Tax=Variovorax paradoxus TaxID=34073 RepID=A0A0D0M3C7_VARPD|nr:hypothetical protein RT97_22550 [Variovorax paradoxus]